MSQNKPGPDADQVRFGVLGVTLSIAQALANRDPSFLVELKATAAEMAHRLERQGQPDAALFVKQFSQSLYNKKFFPGSGQ